MTNVAFKFLAMADLLSLLPAPKTANRAGYGRNSNTNGSNANNRKLANQDELKMVVRNSSIDSSNQDNNAQLISAQIAQQGRRKNEIVHSSFQSLVPRSVSKKDLVRPSKEEEQATAERTKAALDKLLGGKIGSHKKKAESHNQPGNGMYIKYQGNSQNARRAKQRVIRMVEEQIDPLEPAKFKHRKVATGPTSPPAPVLHAPAKKLTKEDEMAWKIPPVVSAWKNRQGFTISLDKRLAADGRGLIEHSVNDRFSGFSEALFIAEKKAREEVKARQEIQRKLLEQSRAEEEEKLRALAARARQQRVANGNKDNASRTADFEKREQIRRERKRERDRELRMEAAGKSVKLDAERDVSEKIALGIVDDLNSEANQFDERLFNQSEGITGGFGAEDEYNMYTKRLFSRKRGGVYDTNTSSKKQKVAAEVDEQLEKIKNSTRFEGTDGPSHRNGGAVQFERDE